MKLKCPNCNTRLDAGMELPLGQNVQCPTCSSSFQVSRQTVVGDTMGLESKNLSSMQVKIIGIDIPFFDMVKLLIEIALASIPAFIILAVIGWLVSIGIILVYRAFGI